MCVYVLVSGSPSLKIQYSMGRKFENEGINFPATFASSSSSSFQPPTNTQSHFQINAIAVAV